MAEDVDVVIAGSGPVGALLALALGELPVSIRLLGDLEPVADRPIALSYGSRLLLERVGVFGGLAATPIESIHVSQRSNFGRTVIRADEHGLPALGYVVSYSDICAGLRKKLPRPADEARVRHYSLSPQGDAVLVEAAGKDGTRPQTIRARLLVVAEGTPSGTAQSASEDEKRGEERRDYGQSALVSLVETERPHRNRAWERFTGEGPLALLPCGEQLALVWSTTHEAARALCRLRDDSFLARLGASFGGRLGRFVHAGPKTAFPLSLRYQRGSPMPHVLAIGNAAQTLHPVAGQGLNLGLRDAWELALCAGGAGVEEIGSPQFVRGFIRDRSLDRAAGIGVTDALVRVFSNSNPALALARGAGLATLDVLSPARAFLARRMMFGARALP
jgi:2-octaprenyl-6-methoxyphenol hydroxylase